jgi:hypothetical protein
LHLRKNKESTLTFLKVLNVKEVEAVVVVNVVVDMAAMEERRINW